MKNSQKTLQQLEKIYSRRRDIEAARKTSLDRKVTTQEDKINHLNNERVETDRAHKDEIHAVVNGATLSRHFNTLSSVLAARKVSHFTTSTRLRYNILEERETLEAVKSEADNQKDATRDAALRKEKMRLLLEAEVAVQEILLDAHEEEETAEAQACRQVSNA